MSTETQLRRDRLLLWCAGGAYLSWWLFVHLALPEAFNPLTRRVGVTACFFAAAGASYVSSTVARHLHAWLAACCSVATVHYFYLFDQNQADLNWIVGSYITVMAVCAVLQTARSLLLYSVLVVALSVAILVRKLGSSYFVFVPGMVTNLLFANLGLHGRLRLLAEQARTAAALVLANRELESFSYSVAHDLRTPLRGINGFSHALREDYGDVLDERAKGYLARIAGASERMGELIDALLALSRVSRADLRREPVDLAQIADAVITQLRLGQPERVVALTRPDAATVEGDPALLRALLENLLGNAWKFTGEREKATIVFGTTSEPGRSVYFVRDNGAGFDAAYKDKLFLPFKRLHPPAEFPGTGVGLATAHRIVHRHGGEIWAEGRVDEGATFYFTLG
jgi:signal transduction histidine kinase